MDPLLKDVSPTSPSHGPMLDTSLTAPIPSQAAKGTFRSLRHRNYRLYFLGQLVSLTGSWVQTTSLSWLAYELTGQSMWPAMVSAAAVLPTFVFGAWGGALVDRWPKRTLLMVTQTIFLALALLLAGLVFAGVITPWQMLAISVAGGLVTAVDLPARLAFVMDLVGREDLINAVALNSLMFNMARVLGPFIAGVVLTTLGPGLCFLLNGLSYVAVLLALSRITVGNRVHPKARQSVGSALLDGFRYVMRRRDLSLLLVLAVLMSFLAWPMLVLLPAFARHRLGMNESGYSFLLSGVGCGALVAALVIASFGSVQRRRTLLASGVVLLSIGLIGLSFADRLGVAILFAALTGFGLILFFAVNQAVFQLGTDDHNRGRIMGIWSMLLSGAQPLGNLLAGPAADHWGEGIVLRAEGIGCVAAALLLLVLVQWSRTRRQ